MIASNTSVMARLQQQSPPEDLRQQNGVMQLMLVNRYQEQQSPPEDLRQQNLLEQTRARGAHHIRRTQRLFDTSYAVLGGNPLPRIYGSRTADDEEDDDDGPSWDQRQQSPPEDLRHESARSPLAGAI